MFHLVLRKQGNSLGVSIPAETRIRMGLEEGQEMTLIELADGFKLVKRDAALESQLDYARKVLVKHAATLRALALR